MALNRTELQVLSQVRIDEAAILLAAAKYDGAYYLAGYAVECALKACIAKLTNEYDFPPDYGQKCYTHNLDTLRNLARLETDWKADTSADQILKANWAHVMAWNERSRYDRKSRLESETIYQAIVDSAHGVLPWIQQRW